MTYSTIPTTGLIGPMRTWSGWEKCPRRLSGPWWTDMQNVARHFIISNLVPLLSDTLSWLEGLCTTIIFWQEMKVKWSRKRTINRKHGDVFKIIQKDFATIREPIDEESMRNTQREVFRKYIQKKGQIFVFNHLIDMKQKCKKKYLIYEKHEVQP